VAIAIGLLKTLLELTRSHKSGALSISGGGTRARVFVENGTIVYADEGTIGETLGRILVREKVLTDAQYNAALERMETLTKKGEKAKLGEILIALGFLTPVQLEAALSAQVRQKVIRAIGWGTSTFRFFECHGGGLDIAARFATPLEPLVLAALRLAPEEHVEELLDLALTRYPELRGDGTPTGGSARLETLRRLAAFELQPAEHDFALLLDGTRTSADILASTSDLDPTIVLSLLLLTDCLDLHASARPVKASVPSVPAPPPSKPGSDKLRPLRRVSPALGMKAVRPVLAKKKVSSVRPPAANELEQTRTMATRLKEAKEAKKSLPLPDPNEAPTTPPPPPSSGKLGELALWPGEAAPSTPMAPVNRILAEKAFQAGKAFVRANNMKDAASELARAATLFPAIEYELWAKWTAMRADKEGDAKHVGPVKALAEKALEQDPSLGFAYFVLGHLALRSRDATRAKELFAKARSLDPATTSEAKDVRLKDAAANTEGAPAAEPAKATASEPAAAEDDHGPNTRPSVGERVVAPAATSSASSAEAPAVEADAPASRRAPKAMPRRNMFLALGGAAVLAIIGIIATRKNETATPNATPPATVSTPVPPPPSAFTPAPSASASAEASAISLDEDEEAGAAKAHDTKSDASIFPADASAASDASERHAP
jgi:hypothetical protein